MNERLGSACGGLVHHLQPRRHDAGADDGRDRIPGFGDIVEGGHDDPRGERFRQELDGDLRDHPKQPFRAGHQGEQVVAGAVERVRADLDEFAFDCDDSVSRYCAPSGHT